jgi:hypothetical protein
MTYRRLFCFVALTGALLSTTATAQVVDFGKYPNFSGQWSRPAGNPNNWRQVAGPPPYTAESEKKFAEVQAISKQGNPANWPSTFCIPTGMPAMMNLYNPMEIVITPAETYVLMSHNNDQIRRIYTDGRSWRRTASMNRPMPAIRSASGSMRMATANTTCSKSRRASSRTCEPTT